MAGMTWKQYIIVDVFLVSIVIVFYLLGSHIIAVLYGVITGFNMGGTLSVFIHEQNKKHDEKYRKLYDE